MNLFGSSFAGLQIVFSEHALQKTTERLFPESKHRSRRVRKKLLKRYGGEFRMQPAMFRVSGKIIAHPTYREAIRSLTNGAKT